MKRMRGLMVIACFAGLPAFAAVEYANDISVGVTGSASFDRATGLYTYRYSLTNHAASTKVLHEFHIPLRGATALNLSAPAGWVGSINRAGGLLGWCACKEEGFVPPAGYVDDGRGIPSAFAVAPGKTLAGFSFQSPHPPAAGTFYAGAWVPVPVEGVDFPADQPPNVPDFPDNLRKGAVVGPLRSDARR